MTDPDQADQVPDRGRLLTRRRLLIGAASGAGLLVVGVPIALDRGRPFIAEQALERGIGDPEIPGPLVWFELTPDGTTLHAPKVEMGQGVHTALAQIALEELPVDPDHFAVRQATTSRGFAPDTIFTFGSTSISSMYLPLRTAAASVREMLVDEAARQLGVDPGVLHLEDGVVMGAARSLTVGDVVAAHDGSWTVLEEPPRLTRTADFRRIGQDHPRVDMRAKLTGAAVYGYDARLPGMRFGAVARPPRFGATLVEATGGRVPGDVDVVVDVAAGFAGVVADTRTRAWDAVTALDVVWEGGTTASTDDLEGLLLATGGAVVRRDGDVDAALEDGTIVEASYRTPYAAHAHLEPLAALAHVTPADGDRPATIRAHVPTQSPQVVLPPLRDLFGDDADIQVEVTYLGGSFGRKGTQDATVEAARLSAAVGAPVHVGWTREDDLRHGVYRPPTHTRLRGSVGGDGRIRGVEQFSSSGDIIWSVAGLPEPVRDTLGFDPGTLLGQFLPYQMDGYRVANERTQLPVPTGPWRGLGLQANVFALESFVDELALAAGTDPLAFRLDHLADGDEGERLAGVLRAAAAAAGWDADLPDGRAHGIACSLDTGTAVAQVAEVSVVDGEVTVHRVTCAVDPGLVVNPAGAVLQATGSVVMGLSSALVETLPIVEGAVEPGNFDTYPILRLDRTPPIDVVLHSTGDHPSGMGEPVLGPTAAAVANAVAAATGERLRDLPLRPSG